MRTTTRLLAGLALIGLMLVSHFASLLHLVVVKHVTCFEHGDLVHAGNDADAPKAGESAALSAAPDDDDHDHCEALAQHRGVTPDLTVANVTVPVVSIDSGEERVGRASLAVLHLAPKASPPRVAL